MLIFSDDTCRLEYAAAQEVLTVELSGQRQLGAREIRKAIISAVACVREHTVERLLLDFRKATLQVGDTDYRYLIAQLAVGLRPSSVKRVARIATQDPLREDQVNAVFREVKKAIRLPLEFRSFDSQAAAIAWLEGR